MPEQRQKKEGRRIPTAEWVAAGIGALILTATIAFLLYEGVAGDSSPPEIIVEIKTIASVRDGYRVEFEARNEGGEAAAHVVIEGVIASADTIVERSETTLDYLPAHSERGGGLFFEKNPQSAKLRIRASGYEDP